MTERFQTHGNRRGSALIATMMVVTMLMAIVLGLQYFEGTSRRTLMNDEANLRFREAYRFKLQQQLIGLPEPGDTWMTASATNVTSGDKPVLGEKMASKIFDRVNGLPDLRSLTESPAFDTLRLKPKSNNISLLVFGKNTFTTVLTSVPGFAIYAPKGNIKVNELKSWSNPAFGDDRPSLKAYSGLKAVAFAGKDVSISKALYADAHTIEGKAQVISGEGVAFKTKESPLLPYADQIYNELAQARLDLRTAAMSGDKTNQLVSPPADPIGIVGMFFDGTKGLEQLLSLRNANAFWLPMIPSFSPSPPYLFQFAFHLPYPPDNASYAQGTDTEKQMNQLGDQMTELGKKLEALKPQIQAAEAKYQQSHDMGDYQAWQNLVIEAAGYQGQIDTLTQQMNAIAGPQKAQIESQASQGMQQVPPTRSQDPSGTDGITGWNYSEGMKLFGKLLGFLFDPSKWNPHELCNLCANPNVKLIYFGGKERTFEWNLNESGMIIDATLTVPRGRTLRLHSAGDITVAGDLWLQRGSTLVVDAPSLTIKPGRGSDPTSFFSPAGRIFMEEGSNLICSDALNCLGSPDYGSVIVGGVPGQIHPITSAIFARQVNLNNGIYAGCAIDDLVEGLGKNNDALKKLNDKLLRPLMANVAPNAAKAIGPFWPRNPYFAKYATTFQIILPPLPPFGEPGPPIPTPIPLPVKNMQVPIARVLAWVYSVNLNLGLGENFMTHCDWWIFGEGVVPVVPQIDPTKAASAISSFGGAALDALDPKTIITGFITNVFEGLVNYAVTEVIETVVKKVAAQIIPYAGLATMGADLVQDFANKMTGQKNTKDGVASSLTSALSDSVVNAGKQTLHNLQSKFTMTAQDEFMREYNGLLVFADDTVTVGGKNASGMFVARNKLTMTAQQCVGTLMSKEGDVECQSLLFYPYFNRASLYVPKATDSDFLLRAKEFNYDSAFSSSEAIDIGPPKLPQQITAQGWTE